MEGLTEGVMGDLQRFSDIVRSNLTEKVCDKSKKKGCFGRCTDCRKKQIHTTIIAKYRAEAFFDDEIDSPHPNVADVKRQVTIDDVAALIRSKDDIGGLTSEERIRNLQAYYAGVDFGDSWDDYGYIDPINEKGPFGRTALHEAVLADDLDRIADLIAEGADPEIVDNSGYTPFQLAVIDEKGDVIKLFRNLDIHN